MPKSSGNEEDDEALEARNVKVEVVDILDKFQKTIIKENKLMKEELSTIKTKLTKVEKEKKQLQAQLSTAKNQTKEIQKKLGPLQTKLDKTVKEKEIMKRRLQAEELSTVKNTTLNKNTPKKAQPSTLRKVPIVVFQDIKFIKEEEATSLTNDESNSMNKALDTRAPPDRRKCRNQRLNGKGSRSLRRINEAAKRKRTDPDSSEDESQTEKKKNMKENLTCRYSDCFSKLKKPLANKKDLLAHIQLHFDRNDRKKALHKGFNEICLRCGKDFQNRIAFKQHLNHHQGIKPYKCPDCVFKTAFSAAFTKHPKNCKRAKSGKIND